jgi:hypothetical protein
MFPRKTIRIAKRGWAKVTGVPKRSSRLTQRKGMDDAKSGREDG